MNCNKQRGLKKRKDTLDSFNLTEHTVDAYVLIIINKIMILLRC